MTKTASITLVFFLSISANMFASELHIKKDANIFSYKNKPYFAVSNRWGDDLFELFVKYIGGNFRNFEVFGLTPFLQEDFTYSPSRLEKMDSQVRSALKKGIPVRMGLSHYHGKVNVPPKVAKKMGLPLIKDRHYSFLWPQVQQLAFKEARFKAERYKGEPVMYMLGTETGSVHTGPKALKYLEKDIVQKWQNWLQNKFTNNIETALKYLGNVKTEVKAVSFKDIPYPTKLDAKDARFGYPARAIALKKIFLFEQFADFLNKEKKILKEVDPNILTCHKITTSFVPELAKIAPVDAYMLVGRFFGDAAKKPVYLKQWYGLYYTVYPAPGLKIVRTGRFDPTNITPDVFGGTLHPVSKPTEIEHVNIFYTNLACGVTAFECWLDWEPTLPCCMFEPRVSSKKYEVKDWGATCAKLYDFGKYLAPYLIHYHKNPQIAFYSNEFATTGYVHLTQHKYLSKIGAMGMIRELGYDFACLTYWDILENNLKDYKVLILAGYVSILPEIQDKIRQFVKNGGTVISSFDGMDKGFPGANSYDYSGKNNIRKANFSSPESKAHLGDVFGIVTAGGKGTYSRINIPKKVCGIKKGYTSLESMWKGYKGLKTELECCKINRGVKVKMDLGLTCKTLQQSSSAEPLAFFATESNAKAIPAIIKNKYGKGVAYTFGLNLGAIGMFTYNKTIFSLLDNLLSQSGAIKEIDTGNWHVTRGIWKDDKGRQTIILVNHDRENFQNVYLKVNKDIAGYAIFEGENKIDTHAKKTIKTLRIAAFDAKILQTLAFIDSTDDFNASVIEKNDELILRIKSKTKQKIVIKLLPRPKSNISRIFVTGVERKSTELIPVGLMANETIEIRIQGRIKKPFKVSPKYADYDLRAYYNAHIKVYPIHNNLIPIDIYIENLGEIRPLDFSYAIEAPKGLILKNKEHNKIRLLPGRRIKSRFILENKTNDFVLDPLYVNLVCSIGSREKTETFTQIISNGKNYALQGKATAISFLKKSYLPNALDSDYPPDMAIDGIRSIHKQNRWSSDLANGKDHGPWWLTVELPGEKIISGVAIYPSKNVYLRDIHCFIEDFKLQYSGNGEDWKNILIEKGFKQKVYVRKFKPVKTKFVRLFITNSGYKRIAQIGELELWGMEENSE